MAPEGDTKTPVSAPVLLQPSPLSHCPPSSFSPLAITNLLPFLLLPCHCLSLLCRWAFLYLRAKAVGLFDERSDEHLPRTWVQKMHARASLVKAAGQRFFWMGASPMAAEQGVAEALVRVRSRVDEAIEAAIKAGDLRPDKVLSFSEKMGALIKLGHAKKAAANSDARALMEAEPELTPGGALIKLGHATKAAANSDARALMEDEPELTPGGALIKLGMAPLVASRRMAKDALEHTWSAEQHRSLDQAAASAAAVASAALWQPSAAAVPGAAAALDGCAAPSAHRRIPGVAHTAAQATRLDRCGLAALLRRRHRRRRHHIWRTPQPPGPSVVPAVGLDAQPDLVCGQQVPEGQGRFRLEGCG